MFQIAAEMFLNECEGYITKEIDRINEDEKFDHPPRKRQKIPYCTLPGVCVNLKMLKSDQ